MALAEAEQDRRIVQYLPIILLRTSDLNAKKLSMSVFQEALRILILESKALPIGSVSQRKNGTFKKTNVGWVRVKEGGTDSAYPYRTPTTPKEHRTAALGGVADAIDFARQGKISNARDALTAAKANMSKSGSTKGSDHFDKAVQGVDDAITFLSKNNADHAKDALGAAKANLRFSSNPDSYKKQLSKGPKTR
jgi:hypothetical protein